MDRKTYGLLVKPVYVGYIYIYIYIQYIFNIYNKYIK